LRSFPASNVVRYFLQVAVATHSHGAPGAFRWLQSQFTLVMLKKPLAMQSA
jgi:hypothetical protein